MEKRKSPEIRPIFGEFYRPEVLWDAESPKPMFASQDSARWFIRKHRRALVAAKAIAKHAGWTLVHPKRFEKVAEAVALAAVSRARCPPE